MDEAIQSILPQPSTVIAPAVRARMSRAVRVLAQQAAIKEVKAQLEREGRIKLSQCRCARSSAWPRLRSWLMQSIGRG